MYWPVAKLLLEICISVLLPRQVAEAETEKSVVLGSVLTVLKLRVFPELGVLLQAPMVTVEMVMVFAPGLESGTVVKLPKPWLVVMEVVMGPTVLAPVIE